ncbi:MAG: SMC-Scp complex subunit ScpB [Planctomycetaceae bacterium]|nr:SMC-Scp complex subunit ScpB [Planctomycetaceae bacterium]
MPHPLLLRAGERRGFGRCLVSREPETLEPLSVDDVDIVEPETETATETDTAFAVANNVNAADSRLDALRRVEAVLFLSREPIASRRLAQFADLREGTRIGKLIQQLNNEYTVCGCAFCVIEVAGGFQLRTRPQFAKWLFRLQEVPVEVRLSSPVMETLAVIAYRQPILRAEIESIRGVQCGEMIRQLLERDLIRIVGKSEELGRPFFYGTTQRFLQLFGLKDINEICPPNRNCDEKNNVADG